MSAVFGRKMSMSRATETAKGLNQYNTDGKKMTQLKAVKNLKGFSSFPLLQEGMNFPKPFLKALEHS